MAFKWRAVINNKCSDFIKLLISQKKQCLCILSIKILIDFKGRNVLLKTMGFIHLNFT